MDDKGCRNTPSLRVQTEPFGRCWYDSIQNEHQKIENVVPPFIRSRAGDPIFGGFFFGIRNDELNMQKKQGNSKLASTFRVTNWRFGRYNLPKSCFFSSSLTSYWDRSETIERLHSQDTILHTFRKASTNPRIWCGRCFKKKLIHGVVS